MAAKYTIEGGESGKERLDVLARVCAPGTTALLDKVGISPGARCLDIGCGGGHVTRELALRAGETGFVLGIDLDATVLELASRDVEAAGLGSVELRRADATELRERDYDIAYARFLLSHVADPARLVRSIADALKPGGVAIVEDVDFTGYFCEPQAGRMTGGSSCTARPSAGAAGTPTSAPSSRHCSSRPDSSRSGSPSRRTALDGDAKRIPAMTLERIAGAVTEEGVATSEDVAQTIRELDALAADPSTLMGMPRVVQAWGTRAVRP